MDANTIKVGALGGMLAGAMMAMFAMLAMWLDNVSDTGFWTPVNLIAHTFWRGAPLDDEFSVGGLILGVVVHMMMAMMLGAVIAVIVSRIPALRANLGSRLATGVGAGLMVWVVMQYILWPLVDESAVDAFTPWIFAVSHVVFGMALAATLHAVSRTGTRDAATA
ncbi:MAG TPA: hypothetical protein VFZ37_15340 [Jiangellaceae bacterium]